MDTDMTLTEAIKARHSVRRYIQKPIPTDVLAVLKAKIEEVNMNGGLHVQLVTDEPKAFSGPMAYGKFSGVGSYLVMAGKKSHGLDLKVGYYGEQLVLLAQQLGLNSCWAGVSYSKVKGTYELADGEKIACYIALGYGETNGTAHKSKGFSMVGYTLMDMGIARLHFEIGAGKENFRWKE